MGKYRKNIFLYFLNRDTLQICGWYRDKFAGKVDILSKALNVSAMLCEEYCLAPPGFFIESLESLSAIQRKSKYLEQRLIRLPMRESSYCEFAEKKRKEYANVAPLYKGLFDDDQIEYLSCHAYGIMHRKLHIGESATSLWEEGFDKDGFLTTHTIKESLDGKTIELIRSIPRNLTSNGLALTWFGMEKSFSKEISSKYEIILRQLLQHNYFSLYVGEYSPVIISDIPRLPFLFDLDLICETYNYDYFVSYLQSFRLNKLIDANDLTILALRRHYGFINFVDTFIYLSTKLSTKLSSANIYSICGHFCRKSAFDWAKFSSKWRINENNEYFLDQCDVDELGDACDFVSNNIQKHYGVSIQNERLSKLKIPNTSIWRKGMISIFVSHSKRDETLASSLIRMVSSCVSIDSSAIRCSSVPGYKYSGATHVSTQIRKEIKESNIVLGIISIDSINSKYVLFELGAGWLLEKSTALLNKDVDYSDIPGPLNECHALKLYDSTDLVALVQLIADKCSLQIKDINIINQSINLFIKNL